MAGPDPRIIVAGDVCVDWLEYPDPDLPSSNATALNWQRRSGARMIHRRGGALLLADFVGRATSIQPVTYRIDNLDSMSPDKIIHSNAELGLYPQSREEPPEKVYRVRTYRGFAGPPSNFSPLFPFTGGH